MHTLKTTSHLLRPVTARPSKWDNFSLSFRDIQRYLKCEKSIDKLQGLRDERGVDLTEVLGETVHEAVTQISEEAREKTIEQFAASIPAGEKRDEFVRTAKDCTKTAFKMRTPGIVEQWKERKLKIRLEGTDCVLVSKPDEINLVKLPNGDEYLEIVEYKTGKIGASAEDQLFFAGLVAALLALQNGWVGNIKLVARCLKTGEQRDWNFSRLNMRRDMAQLKALIKDIEMSVNGLGFDYGVGFHCQKLACRFDCKKFKAWDRAGRPDIETPVRPRSWRRYADSNVPSFKKAGYNRFNGIDAASVAA